MLVRPYEMPWRPAYEAWAAAAWLLGLLYFAIKVFAFLFVYIWIRGTLPRFRYDQLMDFGWKLLLPLAIFNIVFTATWKFLFHYYDLAQYLPGWMSGK